MGDKPARHLAFRNHPQSNIVPWNQIVADYGELIYRAAYRVVRHDGDAEDVTQEVLLEAYRKFQRGGGIPEPGLLRRMATVRAIDRLRRRKETKPLDDQLAKNSVVASAFEQEEIGNQIRRAIGRLPQRDAECFVLRYVEGMSNPEIALALQISPTAVTTALHRARVKLRSELGRQIAIEELT